MNRKSIVLLSAVVLVLYMGMCTLVQHSWNSGCTWFVAEETPVYTPGTADCLRARIAAWTKASGIPGNPLSICLADAPAPAWCWWIPSAAAESTQTARSIDFFHHP